MKYIQEKRSFIFDITKGKKLSFFSDGIYSEIDNHNEFAKEERLIGMKNGQTQEAGQTMLSLWNLRDTRGNERRILIGVLKSPDRVQDTSVILSWIRSAFLLQ
jgi:D-alanyl-D-alanine carboxypeptidase